MSEATTDELDRIEHEIYISVQAEVAWELISRPGWWINDNDVDDHPVLEVDGDVSTLKHPEWGDFAILTVQSDRPTYIAYRWVGSPSSTIAVEGSTLVELWIEVKPGGVTLRVVESGFSALSDDPAVCAAQREQNVEGWTNELRAARAFLTAHRG